MIVRGGYQGYSYAYCKGGCKDYYMFVVWSLIVARLGVDPLTVTESEFYTTPISRYVRNCIVALHLFHLLYTPSRPGLPSVALLLSYDLGTSPDEVVLIRLSFWVKGFQAFGSKFGVGRVVV